MGAAKHVAELGSLMHIFTHLKLMMHVHLFTMDAGTALDIDVVSAALSKRKWVDTSAMETESLSIGMQKCWKLVKDASSRAPTP